MSCLLCDHPDSSPYTLTNLYGETFTYIEQTAQEAVEKWSEDDE